MMNAQKWIERAGKNAFNPKLWYMGKIPFSKIGRTIRYDYNQVIETLKYKQ